MSVQINVLLLLLLLLVSATLSAAANATMQLRGERDALAALLRSLSCSWRCVGLRMLDTPGNRSDDSLNRDVVPCAEPSDLATHLACRGGRLVRLCVPRIFAVLRVLCGVVWAGSPFCALSFQFVCLLLFWHVCSRFVAGLLSCAAPIPFFR